MESSKIIDLLKTFTIIELKDFEKFLQSPYFTNGRDLTPYYKFLIKFYPDFNISKSDLIKKFFKNQNISDLKKDSLVRTYNWELLKLAEEFITIDSVRKSKAAYDDFFIVTLLRRQLGKRSAQVYDEMIEFQDSIKMDHYVFINKMFLQNNGVSLKRLLGKRNETLPLFQSQSENLLNFFLHHAEHLLATIKTNKSLFKTENTSNNIKSFLSNIDFENYFKEREGFENDLEIQKMAIYSILIWLDEKNFEKYIFKLNDSLKNNISNFGKEGLLHISSSILNILDGKTELKYNRLRFDIINYALQNDFYFDNHYRPINAFKFKKAITVALSLNEVEWTKKFCDSYIIKLNEDQQENMKTYAKAYIEFALGNFEKSLQCISSFKLFDIPTNFNIKELQIKNFYKLTLKKEEYFDTLKSFLDAFKHYLNENCKVSDTYYEIGMNFLEGVNILLNYYFPGAGKKKYDAIFSMESYKAASTNLWIVEEMNSILVKKGNVHKKIA